MGSPHNPSYSKILSLSPWLRTLFANPPQAKGKICGKTMEFKLKNEREMMCTPAPIGPLLCDRCLALVTEWFVFR